MTDEVTVTVSVDTLVAQMVCSSCKSRLAIVLHSAKQLRALRFCAVCGSPAAFFNAEDRQW